MDNATSKKRVLGVVLSFLLAFSTMLQMTMPAFADNVTERTDVKITNFTITTTTGNIPSGGYVLANQYMLNMDWDASNYGNELKEGDYFNITLPKELKFIENHAACNFDIYAPNGTDVVAKAVVTPDSQGGGNIKVTFTKYVEDKHNIKGSIHLGTTFNATVINTPGEYQITVAIGSYPVTIPINIVNPHAINNELLNKWASPNLTSDGYVQWVVRINHKKANLTNVVFEDELTSENGDLTGIEYVADSFILEERDWDEYGQGSSVLSSTNISNQVELSANNTRFKYNMGNISGKQYMLKYKTTYKSGLKLKNNFSLSSTEENKIIGNTFNDATSGGQGQGDLNGKIKIIKVDEEDKKPLAGVSFSITKLSDGTTFNLVTGADGTVVSNKLIPGQYKIKEIAPLSGYELNSEEYVVTVASDEACIKTITNKPIKIDISGTKTWDDGNNQDGKRPEKITVNLLKNGSPFKQAEVKPDADGNWKYSFNDLRQYENGEKINYTVTEDTVAEYTPTVDGYNIKNSYTPKKTSVTVSKCWNDGNNQDGKRPNSVKVQLYGDGDKVGDDIELNGGNSWTYTWTDLPEKKEGKTIKYTVQEVGSTEGYTTTQNDQNQGNIIITNKHVPEKTEVKGEKTWNDADNQDGKRPEKITVNLLADGVKVAEAEVKPDADGNWKYSFTDLDKYKDGKEIVYTVTEDAVEGYTPSFEGFNIKNSYAPEETSVTVTKGWNDADDQDGKRPKSIKVQLYGDDEKVGDEVELSNDISWTHTWTGLPKKAKGKDIKYTVQEVGKIEGYTTTVDGSNIGNINILNSHTPEVTKVEGEKTWNDSDNQDGKRPESITVNLLADGKKVDEKTVTKDDNWKYSFENLPKYKEGKEIVYTVTENTVEGYSVSIDGYDIKNSYTPKETTVTVTKCWNDSNDRDKMRPNSLKVQLYANGEKKGEAVELKEGSKWTHTWSKLPQKEKGKEIKYTVKEVGSASGYTVTIDDKNHGNIIITNTHTPKEISGPKTGETNNLMLYIILLLVSASAIAGLFVARKRIMR